MACLDKLNEFYKEKTCKRKMLIWSFGVIKNPKQLDRIELESDVEDFISKSTILTFEKCKENMIDDFCAHIWKVLKFEIMNHNRLKNNDGLSPDEIKVEPIDKTNSQLDSLDIEAIIQALKSHFQKDDTETIFKLSFLEGLPPREIEEMTKISNQRIRTHTMEIRKFLKEFGKKFLL